jgi:hypothetical protein
MKFVKILKGIVSMAKINQRLLNDIADFLQFSNSKIQDTEDNLQLKFCDFHTSLRNCLDRLYTLTTTLEHNLEHNNENEEEDIDGSIMHEIQETKDLSRRLEFYETQLESKFKEIIYNHAMILEYYNTIYPEATGRLELYKKMINEYLGK